MTDHTYKPLERRTFEAIAYNAVGRVSEINTYPNYELAHSTGNSGWSVGAVQWGFGQPGCGAKARCGSRAGSYRRGISAISSAVTHVRLASVDENPTDIPLPVAR